MSEFERIEHEELEEAVQAAEARGEARGEVKAATKIFGAVAGILSGEECRGTIPAGFTSYVLDALNKLFPQYHMSA
ncbi:MAG: hypothetical protein IKD69_02565 [Solobacterium sp.]|nr:hypothetical protein [Solobacterium sp.]